jgi:hypothetical protein
LLISVPAFHSRGTSFLSVNIQLHVSFDAKTADCLTPVKWFFQITAKITKSHLYGKAINNSI